MINEEIEHELENNKADMVFPTNKGYIKVESIEKGRGVTISKSHRISKIIDESTLKGKTFEAEITIKDTVMLIMLVKEKELAEAVPIPTFQPPYSSPKQRIKFKDWTPVGKSRMGRIYKEVVDRMLEAYKEGEPKTEDLFAIVREMYGEHLKESSLASYVSIYKRYIRENKLAVEPPAEESKAESTIVKPVVKPSHIEYNPKGKCLLPINKVVEIWDLLPDEFEYKQVKALVPAYIMQSGSRIDTAKFIIKQFLEIAEFGCEEISAGVFKKVGRG